MTATHAGPLSLLLRGALVQNRMRTALSVLAIALGVALGYAVQLINAAAVNELAQGVKTLSGDADFEIRGPRGGFSEAIYPRIAELPEVAVASPIVEVDAKIAGRDAPLRIVGADVFRAGYLQPGMIPTTVDRLDTLRPDAIFLTPAAARSLGVATGDAIQIQVALRNVTLRVAGELSAAGNQRFGLMDIAGAQTTFDRLGSLARVDVRLRPGVAPEVFEATVRRILPPGVEVLRPETAIAAGASLSRSYRVNLNVLALVALFTGGLLVFSTQTHAVVRRRTQLALLRVLGVTRRRLTLMLVAEGALVGIVGSCLGLVAGFALAQLAVRSFGADLGSGFFRGVMPSLALEPLSLGIFFALGVLAAVLGSFVPACEAARAAPAQALKAGDEEAMYARLRSVVPGVALMALGAGATALPSVNGLPVFGYGAIALLLVGTLMLMPRLSMIALSLLPLPRAAPPRLAISQLRGAPGQVSVSLAAIVASASLTVSMVIMVASFRDSLDAWLDRILPADLYVRAAIAGDTAYLAPDVQATIAALAGVRRADFLREQQLMLDPSRPRVVLQARTVDPAAAGRNLPIIGTAIPVAADAPPPAWVSEAALDLYDFKPGRIIEIPVGGKVHRFTVAGVWRDYGRQQGVIAIERSRYIALTGDRNATNAALWLADGVEVSAVEESLRRAVPGGERLEIARPAEIRDVSLKVFDRTFAVTYALELVAVVIGLVGLSSSFGALVLARRREFGVLRHLGMTKAQIGRMLATEGLVVSAIGLAVGLALGFAISLVLIHVVNRQSFHWGMELSLPWLALAAFAVVLVTASMLTALSSGRTAMGRDVVLGVKDDW